MQRDNITAIIEEKRNIISAYVDQIRSLEDYEEKAEEIYSYDLADQ